MSASSRLPATETTELSLDNIGERFSTLRIVNPEADSAILRSMERYGQIMPVVVSEVARHTSQGGRTKLTG